MKKPIATQNSKFLFELSSTSDRTASTAALRGRARPRPADSPYEEPVRQKRKQVYHLPSPALLNEVPPGSGYDGQELKEIAGRIKSKLEEFNVRGSVVQINPGPVVTTFEYKPEQESNTAASPL